MPFIVGLPRSGTTLLRVMLDNHPALAITPETNWIPELEQTISASSNPHAHFLRFVTSTTTNKRWHDWGLNTTAVSQAIDNIHPFCLREALRALYYLFAQTSNKPHPGDKTPEYLSQMVTIQSTLPEAAFIHIIRDGRAQYASQRAVSWGVDSIQHSAVTWVNELNNARTQSSLLTKYLEIRYEDLIIHPEHTTSAICDFLELPWHKDVVDYQTNALRRLEQMHDAGSLTAEYRRHHLFSLVRCLPDRSRITAWKTILTHDEIAEYEQVARSTLQKLGYPLIKLQTLSI